MPTIRPAAGRDVAAIDALLRDCFPAPDEATLVRDLCVEGDMVLVLVAEIDGALAGLVAFSRMRVDVGGKSVAAVALAPLAVTPEWRRQGVAEPAFYNRFGFATDVANGFASPYAGDYFMALPLQGGLIPCGVRGEAAHAPAFARLGASE
jgi:putative acetyltransferase